MAVRKKKPRDSEDWEDLCDFLDEKEFYIEDMLACVCASLERNGAKEYEASIKINGELFRVRINRYDLN